MLFQFKETVSSLKILRKISLLSTISIKNSSPFYRKNCKNSKIAQKFPFSTIFINYPKLSLAHFSNTFKRYSSFISFSLFLRHGILITVNPDKQTLSPKNLFPSCRKTADTEDIFEESFHLKTSAAQKNPNPIHHRNDEWNYRRAISYRALLS